ncbi:MAG TPA: hypothetical protein DCS16_03190 [Gammaproteobacteria bacterium]|nr:hypothetical protein [Gammaproteobacteria bacterium]
MQKIDAMVAQARAALQNDSDNSTTAVGQADLAQPERSSASSSPSDDLDHIAAINRVFSQLQFAYHNQYYRAFPDVDRETIAKKYWLSCLEDYAPQQIVAATKTIVRSQTFLPSLAELIKACERGGDLFGLPSARDAYFEACSAPSPKKDFSWSHPAVYYAGRAAGWYTLANEGQRRGQPIFEHHYQVFCRRVMRGENLEGLSPTPLPSRVNKRLDPAEAKARFAKLRAELEL